MLVFADLYLNGFCDFVSIKKEVKAQEVAVRFLQNLIYWELMGFRMNYILAWLNSYMTEWIRGSWPAEDGFGL